MLARRQGPAGSRHRAAGDRSGRTALLGDPVGVQARQGMESHLGPEAQGRSAPREGRGRGHRLDGPPAGHGSHRAGRWRVGDRAGSRPAWVPRSGPGSSPSPGSGRSFHRRTPRRIACTGTSRATPSSGACSRRWSLSGTRTGTSRRCGTPWSGSSRASRSRSVVPPRAWPAWSAIFRASGRSCSPFRSSSFPHLLPEAPRSRGAGRHQRAAVRGDARVVRVLLRDPVSARLRDVSIGPNGPPDRRQVEVTG